MKTIQILAAFTFIALFASCSNESKNDVDVHVVEEDHANHMPAGKTLNVEVVNKFDPICGMDNATHLKDTANYQGKTYGFCNTMCKEKFLENPSEHIHE